MLSSRTDPLHLLLKCLFIISITYRSASILKNRFIFEVSCIIYSRCHEPIRTSSHCTNQSIPLLDLSAFSVNCNTLTKRNYWKPRNYMDTSILKNKTQHWVWFLESHFTCRQDSHQLLLQKWWWQAVELWCTCSNSLAVKSVEEQHTLK